VKVDLGLTGSLTRRDVLRAGTAALGVAAAADLPAFAQGRGWHGK
jgi:hypothetical protein